MRTVKPTQARIVKLAAKIDRLHTSDPTKHKRIMRKVARMEDAHRMSAKQRAECIRLADKFEKRDPEGFRRFLAELAEAAGVEPVAAHVTATLEGWRESAPDGMAEAARQVFAHVDWSRLDSATLRAVTAIVLASQDAATQADVREQSVAERDILASSVGPRVH